MKPAVEQCRLQAHPPAYGGEVLLAGHALCSLLIWHPAVGHGASHVVLATHHQPALLACQSFHLHRLGSVGHTHQSASARVGARAGQGASAETDLLLFSPCASWPLTPSPHVKTEPAAEGDRTACYSTHRQDAHSTSRGQLTGQSHSEVGPAGHLSDVVAGGDEHGSRPAELLSGERDPQLPSTVVSPAVGDAPPSEATGVAVPAADVGDRLLTAGTCTGDNSWHLLVMSWKTLRRTI